VVWDVGTNQERSTLPRRPGWDDVLAFSPETKTLAWGTRHRGVQLWELGNSPDAELPHVANSNSVADDDFETPSAKTPGLRKGYFHAEVAFNPGGSPWTFSGDAPVGWQDDHWYERGGRRYTGGSGLATRSSEVTKGNPPAAWKQVAFLHMLSSIS